VYAEPVIIANFQAEECFMQFKISAIVAGIVLLSMQLAVAAVAPQTKKEEKVVKNGSVVSLQYTVSGEDGKTIESNKDGEPLK
jgi:transcription elongation GreA/GreB family factor